MDEELKRLLESINTTAQQMATGNQVATVGALNPQSKSLETESKAVSQEEQNSKFENPLRKNFQAIAATGNYAELGSDAILDNPYQALRAKDATSNFVYNNGQVGGMIATLLEKGAGREGMTVNDWMNANGKQKSAIESGLEGALSQGLFGDAGKYVERALTTASGSGGPTIRTDIEPIMREAYLRSFPMLQQISSIPANGLVHTYNVKTATGEADTIGELGDLTSVDAESSFVRRDNTNIAIIASRRAISLKLQYASQQSGMNFNLSGAQNTEVMSAITAIAKKNQSLIFQGNVSTAGGTKDTEDGAYKNIDFNGLRTKLKDYALTKSEDDTLYDLMDRAVGQIMNAGGDVSNIMGLFSVGGKRLLSGELMQFMRINNADTQNNPTALNLASTGLLTVADTLAKTLAIPASSQTQGIGSYTYNGSEVEDGYIVDPSGMQLAYLGSPNPVVLELPMGFNNTLSNVYVVFLMNGLCLFIEGFHRKIRIPKQLV